LFDECVRSIIDRCGNPRSEAEYRDYGITASPLGELRSQIDEACQVIDALWTRESVWDES
jgi:hypothetical protein